ncbi:UNKNOWN [Stylonychia lemnae]|uniref:Uncharacterized protein n=1 Tax=Stylonychia lemnae TaxID=5949 RepID=A0A078B6Q9_STYLE|nr:UNKNOWN [Stylonychia lemnae]|eukprot:CDW90064.1 UNKNOWN [Stylonychia lemnae]
MPFQMELLIYSNQDNSYYIFSASVNTTKDFIAQFIQDLTNQAQEYFSIYVNKAGYYSISILQSGKVSPTIRNTGIKAQTGFSYIVFYIESFGIGDVKRINIKLYVRNNNNARLGATYPNSYQENDMIGLPQEPTVGTAKYLFGHKGEYDKVYTSMHLDGIIMFMRTSESQDLTTALNADSRVDAVWITLYSNPPTNLKTMLSNDMTYIAKYDLTDLYSGDQIVPDQNDATFTSGALQYGTNSLMLGSSISTDDSDPIYVPNQGILFGQGQQLLGTDKIQLTSKQSIDFTVEVWYRLNYFASMTKGRFQTLIKKDNDFGMEISDTSLRVYFMGKFQDATVPKEIYNLVSKRYNISRLNRLEEINSEWRMISVNYRRSLQFQSTDVFIYFDLMPPIKLTFLNGVYTNDPTKDIYVGSNFEGIIRSVFIYSRFSLNTYFAVNSTDSKTYEYSKPYYEFLTINDFDDDNPTCDRQSWSQRKCKVCSKHKTSSSFPANQCYSTCPLNSYGTSCKECDNKCQFCTYYLPDSCLVCNSDDPSLPLYTNLVGWCKKDFGYYKSSITGTYEKCDDRCISCTDGSNYCERCSQGAYKVDGSYCVWECPVGYQKNTKSGICQVDSESKIRADSLYSGSKCSSGYFYDQDQNICRVCNSSCLTCFGGGDNYCLTCRAGKILDYESKCRTCNNTSQFTIGPLGQCQEICGKGYNLGQLSCDDSNTKSKDGCSSLCQIEQGWICSKGNLTQKSTCSYIRTTLRGIKLTNSNQVYLEFDRPVYPNISSIISSSRTLSQSTISQSFSKSNFKMQILDQSVYNSSWTNYQGNWDLATSQKYPSNIIAIYTDFNKTAFDYSNYYIKVIILNTSIIIDQNGYSIDNQSIFAIAELRKLDYETQGVNYIDPDKFDMITQFVTGILFCYVASICIIFISSLIYYKPVSEAIVILIALQQLYCNHLINFSSRANQSYLVIYLQSYKFALFTWKFEGQKIFIEFLINDFIKKNAYGQQFSESGYYYNQNLVNLSHQIVFWLLLYLVFTPLAYVIGTILQRGFKNNERLVTYGNALTKKSLFSIGFQFFIVFFMPLVLPSLLELKYANDNTLSSQNDPTGDQQDSLNSAITILSFLFLSFVLLILTLLINKSYINELKVQNMFGSLFNPFKATMISYYLYPFYILKSLISSLVIVFARDNWESQTLLLALIHVFMTLYVTFMRPFKLKNMNLFTSFIEFSIFGHYVVFMITQFQNLENFSKVFILMIYDSAMALGTLTIISYNTTSSLYKWIYWRKTGKLPMRKKIAKHITTSKPKTQVVLDTSQIGLLEKSTSIALGKDKHHTKNIKNNTFIQALDNDDKKDNSAINKKKKNISQIQAFENLDDPQNLSIYASSPSPIRTHNDTYLNNTTLKDANDITRIQNDIQANQDYNKIAKREKGKQKKIAFDRLNSKSKSSMSLNYNQELFDDFERDKQINHNDDKVKFKKSSKKFKSNTKLGRFL